ncbi:MAG: phytanoyl-CoA dioxygenase family protein [Planctomycetaceae bacterium]|nr:phytanoyl-CoA dioxygenase family protein [Planctomycetaceae bacterium]
MSFSLLPDQVDQYRATGYLLLQSHFTQDEIDLLRSTAQTDEQLHSHAFQKLDGRGNPIRLSVWNHPGDNLYGVFSRCDRVVGVAEQILEDEPYHYHSKMILKDSQAEGAWEWHQDYGYWYHNGLLEPRLTSCFIAIDAATRENGCLQVIPSSHKMGRLDHQQTGQQAAVEQDRMDAILKLYSPREILMQSGDVLFFHPNLLHRSNSNRSTQPRWAMICCYNARTNNPFKVSHHPCYTPLARLPDSSILSFGSRGFSGEATNNSWVQNATHQASRTTKVSGDSEK